jgi:hypothetical protein
LTYKLERSKLYVSAEWFSGIDKYAAIKGENFEGQSTGEILPNEVTHEVAQVFNMALGAEHRLSSHFTLYGSFWTDYSARQEDSTTNLTVADWDIFHVMGGTTVTFKNTTLTLGIGYSHGSRDAGSRESVLNRPDVTIENLASSFFSDLAYTYSSFVWVFGFTF